MSRDSSAPQNPRRVSQIARVLLWSYCGLVLVFLVAPVAIVVPLAFSSTSFLHFPPPSYSVRWFVNFFSRRDWPAAALTSVKVGCLTSLLSTAIGTATAYGLVRSRLRPKHWIYTFSVSPLIVPSIVLALALYYFFARLRMVGTLWSLVLGHTVLALPSVIVVLSASLQSVDYTLEQAALVHGATWLRALHRVTLPLIRPGVITAALFAFLTSFDELLIALFLSGSGAVTLPRRMWDGLRVEIDPTVAAVALMVMLVPTLTLVGVVLVRRRTFVAGS